MADDVRGGLVVMVTGAVTGTNCVSRSTTSRRTCLPALCCRCWPAAYFAEHDVPVLLRPYHEMNGGWFWWGGKTPASYQQLWQIMYNYLVNTRGLRNLIFVWSPSAWTPDGGDVPWNYYPGDSYVDIVAVDDYNPVYGNGGAGVSRVRSGH